MISKNCENKKEAFEFISFLIKDENQKIFFKEMGVLPTSQNVYRDSLFVSQFPELEYYQNLLNHGFHRPKVEDYTMKSDIISYYVNLAIKKEISPDSALTSINEMIESNKVLIH